MSRAAVAATSGGAEKRETSTTKTNKGGKQQENRRQKVAAAAAKDAGGDETPRMLSVHPDMKDVCVDWSQLDRDPMFKAMFSPLESLRVYGYDVDKYEEATDGGVIGAEKGAQIDAEADAACKQLRDATASSMRNAVPNGSWERTAVLSWTYQALTTAFYVALVAAFSWFCVAYDAAPHTRWSIGSADESRAWCVVNIAHFVLCILWACMLLHASNIAWVGNRFLRCVYRDGYLQRRNPGRGMRVLLKTYLVTGVACCVAGVHDTLDLFNVAMAVTLLTYCWSTAIPERERRAVKLLHDVTSPYAHVWTSRNNKTYAYPRAYLRGMITNTLAGATVHSPALLTANARYLAGTFALTLCTGMRATAASCNPLVHKRHDEKLSDEERARLGHVFRSDFIARIEDAFVAPRGLYLASALIWTWLSANMMAHFYTFFSTTFPEQMPVHENELLSAFFSLTLPLSVLTPLCSILPKALAPRSIPVLLRHFLTEVILCEVFVDMSVAISAGLVFVYVDAFS